MGAGFGDFLEAASTPFGIPRPHLSDEALIGRAGKFVRSMSPITEADEAALLGHYLAYVAAMVGRNPYQVIEGARHYANLFILLIGDTSKGRKGTALDRVEQIVREAYPDFIANNVKSGISSGEGLIYHVRDAEQVPPDADEKRLKKLDPGVGDQRALIVESEFSSVLSRIKMPGNTASQVMRDLWDSRVVQTLTKNEPAKSSNAHVGIVGHGVKEEIVPELVAVSADNGFANRFLILFSDRSKLLPLPPDRPDNFEDLVQDFAWAATNAQAQYAPPNDQLRLDYEAEQLWTDSYNTGLSDAGDGVMGKILSRAEAQVRRVALVYAVIDGATSIRADHLISALALWEYSTASVENIFAGAEATTSGRSRTLHKHLLNAGGQGLTRTELHNRTGNHLTSNKMRSALDELVDQGLAHVRVTKTDGRNLETWFANEDGKR